VKPQPPKDIVEQIVLVHSPEKESLGVKVDKTLIQQFARRIYGTIKEQMITDRDEAEKLLNLIFGGVTDEVLKALSLQDKSNPT